MPKFLIIPKISNLDESLKLAEEYSFGFEYNDFFIPDTMDNKQKKKEIISIYKSVKLSSYNTMHGAFFDIIVFSEDKKIRDVADYRIRESIETALEIGAKGVVFHTNHTPMLKSDFYLKGWIDKNTEYFSRICDEYENIDIYLENMFDDTPFMLKNLSENLSDKNNFGVCLDYAHANVFGVDADDFVKELSPFIKHLHINDNDLKDDLHLAVGDGKIDWNIFKKHFEEDFKNAKSILIETSDINSQRKSAEYLRTLGILK
jgi:sugar phosphate isomerase/epimerase